MAEIRWTLQAFEDLRSIAEFIEKDSSQYAQLFVVDVIEAVDRLADFPKSGRIVPELSNSAVREVILGNYRIVYRLAGQSVHVLTIFHGARLLNPRKLKHT